MHGRWEVRGPQLLQALEGEELRVDDAVLWHVSGNVKTLTLTERSGRITTWLR
jgi:hypothetical protein